jgi:thiamine kinase-like enzyme
MDSPLRNCASQFDSRLNGSKYKTLIHGDAKIDNFCFLDAKYTSDEDDNSPSTVAAVDFQYVGGGCGMRDVAYFFSSVWSPVECHAHANDALEYYFEQLSFFIKRLHPTVEPESVRNDWTPLYAVAWADFYRFLCGWAPGQYDDDPYAKSMVRLALTAK